VAQYRFSAQVIKRSDGRSAVAAAAYRAGERIVDERLEMPFNYRARGGVKHTEIMLPANAPAEFGDRATLWNAAEGAEKRSDARVAREIQVSLPHELDAAQRQELVREFVQTAFVDKGMIADVAFHTPDAEGDQRNYHAHIMLTTRSVDAAGFGGKERDWDKRERVVEWREQWAEIQNRHLERALGPDAPKVTHKSLEAQGINREATIHLGPTASAIERKGEQSDRGDVNREIKAENAERKTIRKEIESLNDELSVRSEQRPKYVEFLQREFADCDKTLRQQVASWKAEQIAAKPPKITRVADVRREIIEPGRTKLRAAERELERTRQRTNNIAAKRQTLASFIRNPARVIWAKIREVHALDRAAREVARAKLNVRLRQDWLMSDPGKAYVMAQVDKSFREAAPAKLQVRTLARKIKRAEKRIKNVAILRERIAIAGELGVKTITTPIKPRTLEQLIRHVDAGTLKAISRASPQQLQQARQTVRSLGRGMTMGFTR